MTLLLVLGLAAGVWRWSDRMGFKSAPRVEASATKDGRVINVQVYRLPNRDLMIDGPEPSEHYYFLQEEQRICVGGHWQAMFGRAWPGQRDGHAGVAMSPGGGAKIETDPLLQLKRNQIAFNEPEGARLVVAVPGGI